MTSLSKDELKKMLAAMFEILGFTDEQIDKTVYDFQKRIAFELLESVKKELPEKYQKFLKDNLGTMADPNNPMVIEIKKELEKMHTKKEYLEKSKTILKRLIHDYINYMSRGLNAEKVRLLTSFEKRV